jgi:beta-glucosidase
VPRQGSVLSSNPNALLVFDHGDYRGCDGTLDEGVLFYRTWPKTLGRDSQGWRKSEERPQFSGYAQCGHGLEGKPYLKSNCDNDQQVIGGLKKSEARKPYRQQLGKRNQRGRCLRRTDAGKCLLLIPVFATMSVGILLAAATKNISIAVVTGNTRVDKLLSEMTIDEKISMIHGTAENPSTYQGQAGYLPGVPRLGIPSVRFSDGPPGILTRVPAMALTATMGLAATFSREDARQNGLVIAREARSHGIDVALEPFINIDRDVTFRRGFNTFGEDPLLTGQIGAAEIRGIQSLGVMSMAKHYIAFDSNDSTDHSTYNVVVEPQALHEIYVAPFVDAVNAGVSSIMCSYNKVDGKYACGNSDTLIGILSGELGFKGFVTSDWGATHATTFINAGLDMEMPGPVPLMRVRPSYFMDGPNNPAMNLQKAVQSGLVSEATITSAAGRVLLEMDRFGLLDGKSKHTITPPDIAANAKVVQKTSEDAAVLLKNDDHALPLTKHDLQSVVLIGPGAGQTIAVGQPGEKSVGLPEREIGTVTALKRDTAAASGERISYAVADDMTGAAIPAEYLSHDGKPGLERTSGATGPVQVDAELNFTKSNGKALPSNASYRWDGILTVPAPGRYQLHMQILGARGALQLDQKKLAAVGRMYVHGDITQAGQNNVLPTTDGLDNVSTELDLTAGPHKLSLSVSPDTSNNPIQIRLSWLTPEQQKANYQAAIDAARRSTTAIVFVWAQGNPNFHLPGNQDQLINDVTAVNPNTIVVLNVCQPVAMPWLNKVKAVLQMWWPGDEGGWATANVLLGRVSPSGRLPFTWGNKLEDYPATDPAHPERSGSNPDGTGVFSEGIFVGYRWFDKQGFQPLFPFGFGLSYTHFEYSQLKIANAGDGGLDVSFHIKNAGARAGDEVPQVYLSAPGEQPQGVQFAVRALAAFDRVHLVPSQSRAVTLHVPLRSLQYWSVPSGRWVTTAGSRTVYVGGSSRDFPLKATTTIRR